MLITIKDFRKDFINKFSPEYQNYIINFCNTFQKTFPDILDNELLIQRISTLNSIEQVSQLNPGEGGRTEYYAVENKNNIKYIANLSEIDKKI